MAETDSTLDLPSASIPPTGESEGDQPTMSEGETSRDTEEVAESPSEIQDAENAVEGESHVGEVPDEDVADTDISDDEDNPGFRISTARRSQFSSVLASVVVHAVVLIVMALLTLPLIVKRDLAIVLEPTDVTEVEEKLEEMEITSPSEFSAATVDNLITDPQLMKTSESSQFASAQVAVNLEEVSETPVTAEVSINVGSPMELPGVDELVSGVGEGTVGVGRSVVDNYDQAFDKLTWEILTLLEKGRVLVVWCFDQSSSMKDDQKVIRDRIDRVYAELGLNELAGAENLMTAVTSYGENVFVHLGKPTDDVETIRAAIDEVPIDASGKELMCVAVAKSITGLRDYAKRTRRQMAMILVTDESGDREDNDAHLEPTLELVKKSRCRVYVLGREAVFGYPYAHVAWEHPQTYVVHYLPVDRGPESAYIEQLQTEGFRERTDSHPSGYGPYEQSRLARESGGIYFMLPSVELDVVGLDKRRYRLDNMRSYKPDLRDRVSLFREIESSPLRSGLLKIIYDMNPYDDEAKKIIVMRTDFSTNPEEFVRQAGSEMDKVTIYMDYLDRVRTALDDIWNLRHRELQPRWRANADLMRAQLLAYKIRLYEYGSYLNQFLQNPKSSPPTKEPDLHFIHWSVSRRQEMITRGSQSQNVELAKKLFADVIENHPGTPWAGRAEKEIASGFGIEFTPYYHRRPAPGGNTPVDLIPVPKI